MPLENPEQIGELRRELKENAVRIPLKAADSGGYLCYVVFEIPEQTECLIARIQITSGLILMLKGRIGEGGIEVNWDRAYGLWQCDKFVAEIFSILKATSPEYLTELNSFYLKITGQSVEERLKEPVKAN